MAFFVCTGCGTQYPKSEMPPSHCTICEDEREATPSTGQRWTTLPALRQTHFNGWRRYEPDLFGIGMFPAFGIGQRALLVRTPTGNVLWDCVTLLDEATVDLIRSLGGIDAIAISHPHYYSSMVEWAHAFDAPVWLHEGDRDWIMRPDPAICLWAGHTHELKPGLTLINIPGHFDGATVAHWAAGADGLGALLSADIVNVNRDRKSVSFMRSFSNFIPLSPADVQIARDQLTPFAFDRLYSAWWNLTITSEGKQAIANSEARYIDRVRGLA
ncbi:MBL fold metallo-hydrolase [Aquabacter sp. CN5-332]|uniref:MBL fold metallo-hydrolase n=1 Tax=Aquabacter sp. CN5-332 TaxID=3156608 RepID=UPI0032B5496B